MGIYLCQRSLDGSTVDRSFCPLPNAIMSSKRSEQTASTNVPKARVNLNPQDSGRQRNILSHLKMCVAISPLPWVLATQFTLMPPHPKSQKYVNYIEATVSEIPGSFSHSSSLCTL
jgi:hypothetical protein